MQFWLEQFWAVSGLPKLNMRKKSHSCIKARAERCNWTEL